MKSVSLNFNLSADVPKDESLGIPGTRHLTRERRAHSKSARWVGRSVSREHSDEGFYPRLLHGNSNLLAPRRLINPFMSSSRTQNARVGGPAPEPLPRVVQSLFDAFENSTFACIGRVVAASEPLQDLDAETAVRCLRVVPAPFRAQLLDRLLAWRSSSLEKMQEYAIFSTQGTDRKHARPFLAPEPAVPLSPSADGAPAVVDGKVVGLGGVPGAPAHRPMASSTHVQGVVLPVFECSEHIVAGTASGDHARGFFYLACDLFLARAIGELVSGPAGRAGCALPDWRLDQITELALQSLSSRQPEPLRTQGWTRKALNALAARWRPRWVWLHGHVRMAWQTCISSLAREPSQQSALIRAFSAHARAQPRSRQDETAAALCALRGVRLRIDTGSQLRTSVESLTKITQLFRAGLSGRARARAAVLKTAHDMLSDVPGQTWAECEDYRPWLRALTRLYDAVWAWARRRNWEIAVPILVATLQCCPPETFLARFGDLRALLSQCVEQGSDAVRLIAVQGATSLLKDYLTQLKGSRRDVRLQTVEEITTAFFLAHPSHPLCAHTAVGGAMHDALVDMIGVVAEGGYLIYAMKQLVVPVLTNRGSVKTETDELSIGVSSEETEASVEADAPPPCEPESADPTRLLVALRAIAAVSKNPVLAAKLKTLQKRRVGVQAPMLGMVRQYCHHVFNAGAKPSRRPDKKVENKGVADVVSARDSQSLEVYTAALDCVPLVFEGDEPALWSSRQSADNGSSRALLVTVTDSVFHTNDKVSASARRVVQWSLQRCERARGLVVNRMAQISLDAAARLDTRLPDFLNSLDECLSVCIGARRPGAPSSPAPAGPGPDDEKHEDKKMAADDGAPLPLQAPLIEALCLCVLSHGDPAVRTRGPTLLKWLRRARSAGVRVASRLSTRSLARLKAAQGEWGLVALRCEEAVDGKGLAARLVRAVGGTFDNFSAAAGASGRSAERKWTDTIRRAWRGLCHDGALCDAEALAWMSITSALTQHLSALARAASTEPRSKKSRARGENINSAVTRSFDVVMWRRHLTVALIGGQLGVEGTAQSQRGSIVKRIMEAASKSVLSLGVPSGNSWLRMSASDGKETRSNSATRSPDGTVGKAAAASMTTDNALDLYPGDGPSSPPRAATPLHFVLMALLRGLGDTVSDVREASAGVLSFVRAQQLPRVLRWAFKLLPIPSEFENGGLLLGGPPSTIVPKLADSERRVWKSVALLVERVTATAASGEAGEEFSAAVGGLVHPYLATFLGQTVSMLTEKKNELRWDLLGLRIQCCSIAANTTACARHGDCRPLRPTFRGQLFDTFAVWSGVTVVGNMFFHRAREHQRLLLPTISDAARQARVSKSFERQMAALRDGAVFAITGLMYGPAFCPHLARLASAHVASPPRVASGVASPAAAARAVDVTHHAHASATFGWLDAALQLEVAGSNHLTRNAVEALGAVMLGNPSLVRRLFLTQCYVGPEQAAERYFEAVSRVLLGGAVSSLHDEDAEQPRIRLTWPQLVVLLLFALADEQKWVRSLAMSLYAALPSLVPDIAASGTAFGEAREILSADGFGINSTVREGGFAVQREASRRLAALFGNRAGSTAELLLEARRKLSAITECADAAGGGSDIGIEARAAARARAILRVLPAWCARVDIDSPGGEKALVAMLQITEGFSCAHPELVDRMWMALARRQGNIGPALRALVEADPVLEGGWAATARRAYFHMASERPREAAAALAAAFASRFQRQPESQAEAAAGSRELARLVLLLEPLSEMCDVVGQLRGARSGVRVALFVAMMSVVGSQDPQVRRAARHSLANVLYHQAKDEEVSMRLHRCVSSESGQRSSDVGAAALHLVERLTGGRVPTRVHSLWYALEKIKSRPASGADDEKAATAAADSFHSGELLSIVSAILGGAGEDGSASTALDAKWSAPSTAACGTLMGCAFHVLFCRHRLVGDATTAALLFVSLARSQPAAQYAPRLCAKVATLVRDIESVAPASVPSASESEPLERLYLTLDCLLAILQQIPEVKELPLGERGAEARHARIHTAVSPAAKLRDPNNVDRVLVSSVTAAASAATVLFQRMHPGREPPRALRACFDILGSAFARVRGAGRAESDLVRQVVAGDGIWPIALRCLDRTGLTAVAKPVLLEAALWRPCALIDGVASVGPTAAGRTVHRTVVMSLQCVFCLMNGDELSALEKLFLTKAARAWASSKSDSGASQTKASMRALVVAIAARANVTVPSGAPSGPRIRAKSAGDAKSVLMPLPLGLGSGSSNAIETKLPLDGRNSKTQQSINPDEWVECIVPLVIAMMQSLSKGPGAPGAVALMREVCGICIAQIDAAVGGGTSEACVCLGLRLLAQMAPLIPLAAWRAPDQRGASLETRTVAAAAPLFGDAKHALAVAALVEALANVGPAQVGPAAASVTSTRRLRGLRKLTTDMELYAKALRFHNDELYERSVAAPVPVARPQSPSTMVTVDAIDVVNVAPSAPPKDPSDRVVEAKVVGFGLVEAHSMRPADAKVSQGDMKAARPQHNDTVKAQDEIAEARDDVKIGDETVEAQEKLAGDISAGQSPLLGLPPRVTRNVRPVALCESFSDATAPAPIPATKQSPEPKPQPEIKTITHTPVKTQAIDLSEPEPEPESSPARPHCDEVAAGSKVSARPKPAVTTAPVGASVVDAPALSAKAARTLMAVKRLRELKAKSMMKVSGSNTASFLAPRSRNLVLPRIVLPEDDVLPDGSSHNDDGSSARVANDKENSGGVSGAFSARRRSLRHDARRQRMKHIRDTHSRTELPPGARDDI